MLTVSTTPNPKPNPSPKQVGCCGLQLYRFGEAISICFFSPNWRPDSFYDKLLANRASGLHSLLLLDIKAGAGVRVGVGVSVRARVRVRVRARARARASER